MMDVNKVLFHWVAIFLIKRLLVVVLKTRISQIKKLVEEFHKQIIKKFE